MENKTRTFGEWWCRKLNNNKIKNNPELRNLTNDAWNEAINLKELYVVLETFPELRPVKSIIKKVISLFKRRRILSYWYNPIKGIFVDYKSAKEFINKNKKETEWYISREVFKK